MIVTKGQLAVELSEALGIPKSKARESASMLLQLIRNHLENGEDVICKGFGVFKSEQVEESTRYFGFNKKYITIPAHKRVRFKPCHDLQSF